MEKEYPIGVWNESKRNELLPTFALNADYQLVELTPVSRYDVDPFILYDRWGRIVHQWPDDYMPSWAEVADVCRELGIC